MGKARGKTCSAILVIWLVFTVGLVAAIKPAKAQDPFVTVYVNQPLGYIPFVAPDGKVTIDIYIETSGISDGNLTESIVAWGMDVQVDPDILDVNLTAGGGFPPAPAKARVIGAAAGYCMFDYSTFYGDLSTNLLAGTSDPSTGYWDDIAEGLLPWTYGGIGDYITGTMTVPPKLVTLEVESKSDTQSCVIELIDVEYVTPDGVVHPVDIVVDGYYGGLPPPHAEFTYTPSMPLVGDTVTFNGSASYDPDGGNETYPSGIVSYAWDFGDETKGTGNITSHAYTEAGTYTVTLNVTDDEGSTNSTTKLVTVSGAAAAAELRVEVQVGSIHFRGEIAEFYVLTSFMGEPVNATQINARLYYGGTLHGDLSGSVENVTTGLYRVPYTIPSDASAGTYVLVVNASFLTQKGVSLESFLLSPTLTDQNALITSIVGDMATVLTNVGAIRVDLTAIDATLVGIEGTMATISSTIGELEATTDSINAIVIDIEDDVATIDSTLGSIEADIEDINTEIISIDGTLVTIQTSIGLIETNVTAINAKIADVQDGLVTINSTLGAIQLDLADVKDDISFELVSVIGDIEEGLADVTAAITDAEGNILVELGHVEVTLEDINSTLEIIDGNLVTIRTDIGTIEGTITSIRGDIATIETDIGTIEAILEEWTGVTTSSITTPVGTFDIMVLTNSTLEGPVTFSDNALTMIVSGQTGTTGILNVKIPRQLLIGIESNIEDLMVTINGRQASFTYTEEAELYMVRATYTHSTHTIKIFLSESQTSDARALWILLVAVFTIAMSAIVAIPYVLATRKRRIKQ